MYGKITLTTEPIEKPLFPNMAGINVDTTRRYKGIRSSAISERHVGTGCLSILSKFIF